MTIIWSRFNFKQQQQQQTNNWNLPPTLGVHKLISMISFVQAYAKLISSNLKSSCTSTKTKEILMLMRRQAARQKWATLGAPTFGNIFVCKLVNGFSFVQRLSLGEHKLCLISFLRLTFVHHCGFTVVQHADCVIENNGRCLISFWHAANIWNMFMMIIIRSGSAIGKVLGFNVAHS